MPTTEAKIAPQNIKVLKEAKVLNIDSGEKDLKLNIKLESANKHIEELRNNEKKLLKRISCLEASHLSLKTLLSKAEYKVKHLELLNDTLFDKIKEDCKVGESKGNSEPITFPLPAFMKVLELERNLSEEGDFDDSLNMHSPELNCESILSTDENFLGVINNKPWVFSNRSSKIQSVSKRIHTKLNKSAIGPKNLEMKKCNQSSYYGATMQNTSARSRMISSKCVPVNLFIHLLPSVNSLW